MKEGFDPYPMPEGFGVYESERLFRVSCERCGAISPRVPMQEIERWTRAHQNHHYARRRV